MTAIEDLRRKKAIIDAFSIEALDIMEIATLYNASVSDVMETLREFQCGSQQMRASNKFKKKVISFATTHPEVSTTNVARTYFLKDEKSVRTWWKIYGVEHEQESKQHSLLEQGPPINWKAKYEQAVAMNEELRFEYDKLYAKHELLKNNVKAAMEQALNREDDLK